MQPFTLQMREKHVLVGVSQVSLHFTSCASSCCPFFVFVRFLRERTPSSFMRDHRILAFSCCVCDHRFLVFSWLVHENRFLAFL